MHKTFDAKAAEARISAMWEKHGCFRAGANASSDETFCIVIPPPNVTGSLHMGHALNNTVQDILVRLRRMQGRDTLWQPGTDHAGIATQMVVERKLVEEGGASRREMGRDAFIERVWRQKEESERVILGQLKRLGASCDWSRTEFTMSETLSAAVLKVFVQLYNEGLIYRGKRLVNWDPKFETAISDLEVENIEVDGHMWHFKYPLADGETYDYVEKDADGNVALRETRDYISIATTRPETMLGDGAVAVHPSDERYAPIVGRLCEIPVGPKEHRRLIPIIADEYPDPDFGSGAVKITGAHDFNDHGVAARNNIPCYRLMDAKAAMRADGEPYAAEAEKARAIVAGTEMTAEQIDAVNLVPDRYRGLDRYEARKRIVADITAEGLAVATVASDPRLGRKPADGEDPDAPVPLVEAKRIVQPFGDRSRSVIEPMLTDQWFVDAAALAGPAVEAVRSGRTKFVPGAWEKTYFQWLENIEPWCISRQLWWGHRIPVWYGREIESRDKETGAATYSEDARKAFAAESEEDALALARDYYGGDVVAAEDWPANPHEDGPQVIVRDPDVLDTWFSSALWPFSTLGWPEKTPELAKYYKTDVLVTGFDIIFFWVVRMMMAGLHVMKDRDGRPEAPFHTVYVHALVRDAQGKKMSKSLGNVIDPLKVIDEYGADALRFTLASMAAMGRDIKLDVKRVAGYRNFGTKLWNAARFAEMNGCYEAGRTPATTESLRNDPPRNMVNRWILGETVRVSQTVQAALEAFRFNDAANALYAHVWGAFCDWYLELSKPLLQGANEAAKAETRGVAAWALDQCLILLHPIMPFITEELWGNLSKRPKMLCHTAWPNLPERLIDPAADDEIGWVVRLIEEIRSVRVQMNVPAGAKIDMIVTGHTAETKKRLMGNKQLIQRLARLSECTVAEKIPEGAITIPMEGCTVNLSLSGVIDMTAETARLKSTASKINIEINGLKKKLENESFLSKAPEHIIEEQRERLAGAEAEAAKLTLALGRLDAVG